MKILMIANSFGVNLQSYAKDIAKANGLDLDIYVLYIGGCSLETHFNNIKEDKKDYELFCNGVTTGKFISIKEALELDKWDKISLQQASHECGNIASYYPFFGEVYNYVKSLSPHSEIIFHKTWAYSPVNTFKYDEVPSWWPSFKFKNAKEMNKGINEAVNKVTKEFNIKTVINSGDVCELSMKKKFMDVYDSQGFHVNGIGNYLIGCNFIKILINKKLSVSNVYIPHGLGKETCLKCVKFINKHF